MSVSLICESAAVHLPWRPGIAASCCEGRGAIQCVDESYAVDSVLVVISRR